jgi:hypothetical protein
MQNILQQISEVPRLKHLSIMFSDRPYPHKVVLMLFIGFLIVVIFLFFFIIVIFIIVTRIIWIVASRGRGLALLVLVVLKMTLQLQRLVILPMGWTLAETPLSCPPEQLHSPQEGDGDP